MDKGLGSNFEDRASSSVIFDVHKFDKHAAANFEIPISLPPLVIKDTFLLSLLWIQPCCRWSSSLWCMISWNQSQDYNYSKHSSFEINSLEMEKRRYPAATFSSPFNEYLVIIAAAVEPVVVAGLQVHQPDLCSHIYLEPVIVTGLQVRQPGCCHHVHLRIWVKNKMGRLGMSFCAGLGIFSIEEGGIKEDSLIRKSIIFNRVSHITDHFLILDFLVRMMGALNS